MKDCNQCGKCCIKYGGSGLSASDVDLQFWEVSRPDISAYVQNGEIWFNPDNAQVLQRCPWLIPLETAGKYGCSIYLQRPEDCRFYPTSINEMLDDDCEMLEVKDLQAPKKAQQQLDALMADSRPPLQTN